MNHCYYYTTEQSKCQENCGILYKLYVLYYSGSRFSEKSLSYKIKQPISEPRDWLFKQNHNISDILCLNLSNQIYTLLEAFLVCRTCLVSGSLALNVKEFVKES